MTKYDFKLRRGVFRSGKIRTQRDFSRFEKGFMSRRRSQGRLRLIITMIAIVILMLVLLLTIRVFATGTTHYYHEIKIENTNQLL
ncbi:MAG: hypothetical protein ABFS32_22600 [Bacteroidota bacterium]